MSSDIISEDLRSIKTKKALYTAMFTLLKKHSFRKITIKGICEEALISRAAFYAHYIDKYDLLEHSMKKILPNYFKSNNTYEQIETAYNCHIYENMVIFENLINDADNETLGILFDYVLSTMNLTIEKTDGKKLDTKNIVLSNFYAGGILSYLFWQVKNKFPTDVPPMNSYFYEIIDILKDWQTKLRRT